MLALTNSLIYSSACRGLLMATIHTLALLSFGNEVDLSDVLFAAVAYGMTTCMILHASYERGLLQYLPRF